MNLALKEQMTQQSRRFLVVGALVLAMLIPLAFVQGLVDERQSFYNTVFNDISAAWGQDQHVIGPLLVVPEIHRYQVEDKKGNLVWRAENRHRVHLPAELVIGSEVTHQTRQRAIYQVPVYQAQVSVSGKFQITDHSSELVEPLLADAQIVVGLAQPQAISEMSDLKLLNQSVSFAASTGHAWLGRGVNAKVTALADTTLPFQFTATLKGSKSFSLAPVGDENRFQMQASWPHPSFSGMYLPNDYTIDEQGFEAHWSVHELARDLPKSWLVFGYEPTFDQAFASVSLFQPITNYTVVDRGTKYGILFIGLTFLTFVCFEMLTAIRFHYIQYAAVGAGLVLFYLTLLSLSEHLPFAASYVLATTILTALISWYVWAMTHESKLTIWCSSVVLGLYSGLYVLLQLEDFSLLVGTGILLLGLFALMYTTRHLTSQDDEEHVHATHA